MANPPFNMDKWWNESLANDPRWQYGTPPKGNANFAWLQHMLYHLCPTGRMGLLLANGSMSSQTNNEGVIRQKLIEADLVECMVALPGQLFTNTQIPACIWFLNKAKKRKKEILFIDARQIGYMKDRVLRDFTTDDVAKIADTYHHWQQQKEYENIASFCYSASLEEVEKMILCLPLSAMLARKNNKMTVSHLQKKSPTSSPASLMNNLHKGKSYKRKLKNNLAIRFTSLTAKIQGGILDIRQLKRTAIHDIGFKNPPHKLLMYHLSEFDMFNKLFIVYFDIV